MNSMNDMNDKATRVKGLCIYCGKPRSVIHSESYYSPAQYGYCNCESAVREREIGEEIRKKEEEIKKLKEELSVMKWNSVFEVERRKLKKKRMDVERKLVELKDVYDMWDEE